MKAFSRQFAIFAGALDRVHRPDDFGGWVRADAIDEKAAAEVQRLIPELDRLAGRAANAADMVGMYMRQTGPPAFGMPEQRINPLRSWQEVLSPSPGLFHFDTHDLASWVRGLEVHLESEIERTRLIESSLAGRIARILSFPASVREAMGLPRHSVGGRTVAGIVGALMLTIVGGVVTGLILALLKLS